MTDSKYSNSYENLNNIISYMLFYFHFKSYKKLVSIIICFLLLPSSLLINENGKKYIVKKEEKNLGTTFLRIYEKELK